MKDFGGARCPDGRTLKSLLELLLLIGIHVSHLALESSSLARLSTTGARFLPTVDAMISCLPVGLVFLL